MKIAAISTVYGSPWAGSEELWYQTAVACRQQGHEFLASLFEVSEDCHQIQHFQERGGVVDWRKRIRGGRLRNAAIRVRSSFRRVFQYNPDVLLLSLGSLADLALHPDLLRDLDTYAGRVIVICLFNSDHLTFEDGTRQAIAAVLARADHCVFVSEHNRKLAERQLSVHLQNTSVFSAPVSFSTDHQVLDWPAETTVQMACVARHEVFAKGQDVLLESLSESQWRDRDWHLRIYGQGRDRAYIERLTKHYGLQDRCSFPGFASDTRDIWKQCHLMTMASRAEGLSLAVLEAMLCGRVCVVTDVGGHAEVIDDARSGFLAEAASPKYFAAALERAWEHRGQWMTIGKAAAESASEVFAETPVELLGKIINRDPG